MKKSYYNKFLFPTVLIIWMGVIVRFWGGCQATGNQQVAIDSHYVFSDPKNEQDEDYPLKLNYRDPFLDQVLVVASPKNYSQEPSSPQLTKIEEKPLAIVIPKVIYQGGVQSTHSRNMTGILTIEGNLYQVQTGDSVSGLYIDHLDFESIRLVRSDTSWVVRRN